MYFSTCGREIVNLNQTSYRYLARRPPNQLTAYANCYPRTALAPQAIQRHGVAESPASAAAYYSNIVGHMDPIAMVRSSPPVLLVLFPVPFVPAILGYFVAWIVIPKAEDHRSIRRAPSQVPQGGSGKPNRRPDSQSVRAIPGGVPPSPLFLS